MSKFQLTASAISLATQIADLINSGRQLYVHLVPSSILASKIQYIIELDGEKVVGAVGLDQKSSRVTEIKHLVVHPQYRRRGIGKKLLERAITAAQTDFVYGYVREDNLTNIRNNFRVGMRPMGKSRVWRGHRRILFVRRRHDIHTKVGA